MPHPSAPPPSFANPSQGPPPAPRLEPGRALGAIPPSGPRPSGTNGFAIASAVLGTFGGVLLSVIFGCVALGQVRRTGQDGRGLAIAGLVLSGLWVLGGVVIVAVALTTSAPANGSAREDRSVPTTTLRVGQCLSGIEESDDVRSVPATSCRGPHQGEVFALFTLPAGEFPGEDEVDLLSSDGCRDRLVDYGPAAANDPTVEVFFIRPRERGWHRGDRRVTCIATSTSGTLPAGSIAGRAGLGAQASRHR